MGDTGAAALDPQFYAGYYDDLAALSPAALAEHWQKYGRAEGRLPSFDAWLVANGFSREDIPEDFSEAEYCELNSDVPCARPGYATRHFLVHGRREQRWYRFDEAFYTRIYPDLAHLDSRAAALAHWFAHGANEKRLPTLDAWLAATGRASPFPQPVDLEGVRARNPHAAWRDATALRSALLLAPQVPLLEVYTVAADNAALYARIGEFREATGARESATDCYRYALMWGDDALAHERLGVLAMEASRFSLAADHLRRALARRPGDPLLAARLARCLFAERDLAAMIDVLHAAIAASPGSSPLAREIQVLLADYWDYSMQRFDALIVADDRATLVAEVGAVCAAIAAIHRQQCQGPGGAPAVADRSHRRVLIIGDCFVPQCVRYRIEQKREQLAAAGYACTVVDWTAAGQARAAIPWHDVVIFYRTPAFPAVISLIEYARSLGKLLVYEIDDLVFDPVYPPSLASYGGNISTLVYADLMRGMALFRAAATLCDYAIASTLPLLEKLRPLVRRQHGFLHRNGLDALHGSRAGPRAGSDTVTIFYGSGTLAHNADFVDEALPALARILDEFPQVRLMIVGHLTLPAAFVAGHAGQLLQLPLLRDVRAYLHYLSEADINLAVLRLDSINDCKSELKWFEAACYSVPSVMSPTRNYRDLVRDGEDGLLAAGEDQWYRCLRLLVEDAGARARIGAAAHARVRRDYAVTALAAGLDRELSALLARPLAAAPAGDVEQGDA